MFQSIDDVQKFSRENVELVTKSLNAMSHSVQMLAADTADYTRKSVAQSTAAAEKLIGAKSLDKAVEIQSAFAKESYQGFIAHATKMGEVVTNLARESYKPFEGMLSRSSSR
jgi:hypothetical protein